MRSIYIGYWNPLRWLGFFKIDGWGLRGRLFDVYLRWALGAGYSVYHDSANIHLGLIFLQIYIKVPMLIRQRPGTEDWNASYGFSVFGRSVHLNWRDRYKIVYFPWDFDHVRHSYYWPSGELHHHAGKDEYQPPEETKLRFPYAYTRRSGEVQNRTATVNGEEREWRWRWFTWSPFPRMIRRTINVDFNDEVGERAGSWKGGVTGCGYEWLPGETLESALRRMERERTFD